MTTIILNADDFGRDANTTMAIAEAMQQNWCSNTTIMVNMPWCEKAKEIAVRQNFLERVGMHLNISQGKPLLEETAGSSWFCDEEGNFNLNFLKAPKYRWLLPKEPKRLLQKEMEAQITRYFELGFTQRHIDSHHHIHSNWSVLQCLKPLLKKYHFRSIRREHNLHTFSSPVRTMYRRIFDHYLAGCCPEHSDYLCSLDLFLQKNGNIPQNALVEIMLHPDYKDGVLIDADGAFAPLAPKMQPLEGMTRSFYH